MTIINCFEKEVYGNVHIYCADEYAARALQMLTGKKTISREDIRALNILGIGVELIELPKKNGVK